MQDLKQLFPDNDRFKGKTHSSDQRRMVAIKKTKMNAFNDRDGIQFYALREIKNLVSLQGKEHVVQLLDVFYADSDSSICLVLEYLANSLESLLRPIASRPTRKEESDSELEMTTEITLDFDPRFVRSTINKSKPATTRFIEEEPDLDKL